jgi:hypothetical protein
VLLILGERLKVARGSHSGNCSKKSKRYICAKQEDFLTLFSTICALNVLDVYMCYDVLPKFAVIASKIL